jgi:Protein of unknown function (DUF4238)
MNNINPTKKQHFVPQFYLKRFANEQNLLHILDVKNGRLGIPRTTSGLGYEKYFYAAETGVPDEVSQHIEQWLQTYETVIARDLQQIIDKILNYKQIDDDDRYILSALMCMLWLRSPTMRNHLHRMNEDMTKQMMRLYVPHRVDLLKESGVSMSDQQRTELIKTLETGSYALHFNNAQHLRFMTETFGFGDKGFTNMFFGHKWKIYIAKGKKHFITADGPVVEWWPPPQSFYGASFLERNKYFALTPEIFFELTYPLESDKARRETIFEDQDDSVMLFNILLAAHASQFAYSGERAILENLIAGRANPGSLERTYFERFVRPWQVAKKDGQTS